MTEWLEELPSIKKEVTYMKEDLVPFRKKPGKWGILATADGDEVTKKNLNSMGSTLRRNFGEEFMFAVRGGNLYAKFLVVAE